ncbi:MAG: hypothetical protein ACFB3T_01985 [Geminicoccaceae bacterium]
MRRRALVLLALLAAACARPQEPPPPPPAPTVVPPTVQAPPPPPELCDAITAIVRAEQDDYAPLRTEPTGPARWRAAVQPAEFERCEVRGPGEEFPQANLLCETYEISTLDGLRIPFQRLEDALDGCLLRQQADGRTWRKADDIPFGDYGAQSLWEDPNTWPRSVIVLRVAESPSLLEPTWWLAMEAKLTRGNRLF